MSFFQKYCGCCPCSCCKTDDTVSRRPSVDSRGVPTLDPTGRPRGLTTTSLTNAAYETEDLDNSIANVGYNANEEDDYDHMVIVSQPKIEQNTPVSTSQNVPTLTTVVDEDDINLQSIEKKDSSSDEDEVSPVAKHTPSVKDRMEAMGAVPLPVLARPEELAEQKWPEKIQEENTNNSASPGHNLIKDLGITNPVMVHTESDSSSTNSSGSEAEAIVEPPHEIHNLRQEISLNQSNEQLQSATLQNTLAEPLAEPSPKFVHTENSSSDSSSTHTLPHSVDNNLSVIKSPEDFKSQIEINDAVMIASHDDFKSQTSINKIENKDIPEPEDFIAEEIIAERRQSEISQISEDPDMLSPKSSKHVTLNTVPEQVFVQTDSDCSDSVSFSHKNPPTQYQDPNLNPYAPSNTDLPPPPTVPQQHDFDTITPKVEPKFDIVSSSESSSTEVNSYTRKVYNSNQQAKSAGSPSKSMNSVPGISTGAVNPTFDNNEGDYNSAAVTNYIDTMLGNNTNTNSDRNNIEYTSNITSNQDLINQTFTLELDNNNQVNLNSSLHSPGPPANFVQTESDSSSTASSLT